VWGSIADHFGRKVMVLRAMLGIGVAFALVPFAPSPLWFAALLMLVSLFNGYTPAGVALIVSNTPPSRIGRSVALAQTGGMVGHALGPALGAAIAAMLDRQHSLFWISACITLCGGMLVVFLVREVKQPGAGPWRLRWLGSLRELAAVPRVGLLIMLSFLFAMMWHGSVTNISVFVLQLLEKQGGSAADEAYWVGAAAFAMASAMLVGLPFWGRTIDRIGPERVLVLCAAAAVLTHLPLLVLQTPLQLAFARAAFGLAAAGMPTAIFHLLRIHAPTGMDARAISYSTAFHFLAMGIAPFVAGLVGPAFGMRAYFALTMLAMLGGLTLWLRGAKKT
jgi:DHA1 family multidrug resistance protein-like MFS transporter